MKAIVFKDNQLRFIKDYPKPEPQKGEALIKVLAAGICNTDLEIVKGYMGFSGVLGHEFVGEVVNTQRQELNGHRVVGEINCGCGDCAWCDQELIRHCQKRQVLGILNKDGALAEYLSLPEANLHLIPDEITDLEAVFVEPLAAAFEILEQVHIEPQMRILLLGDGKLGLLIAQALKLTGCKLTVVGKHSDRLARLASLGIDTCLLDQLDDRKYDMVIEASGSPEGLKLALTKVRPRGKIILKTTTAESAELNLNKIVVNEIELIGSRCGPYAPAIRALAQKQVQAEELISHKFSLDQAQEAFQAAASPQALKVVIRI